MFLVYTVQSFIENNIRPALVPTLISFFQGRKLKVKWQNIWSKIIEVSGGGPQGGNAGILEYISQTKGNLDFVPNDQGFKFVDDASLLELLNLLSVGLCSINQKAHVASDLPPGMKFIPPENTKTQGYLNQVSNWTNNQEMILNPDKTKIMIVNFCQSYQFKTRLTVDNSLIEQVNQTKLLGVVLSDDMSWQANTKYLVKKAYTRMLILRRLNEFNVDRRDMIKIYILFIRVVIEQSSVVWSSSLTQQDMDSLERTQKVALRIIFQDEYISYQNALNLSGLLSVSDRYKTLLYKFAVKCVRNPKTEDIIQKNEVCDRLRHKETYAVPMAKKQRLFKSAIPTMARMLNEKPVNM